MATASFGKEFKIERKNAGFFANVFKAKETKTEKFESKMATQQDKELLKMVLTK